MKQRITDHLDDPESLERLYRTDKNTFTRDFPAATEGSGSELVKFWKIRLAGEPGSITRFSTTGLASLILIALVTAVLAKLPSIVPGIEMDFFYPRNMAIIVFNGLILFTFWTNRIGVKWILAYTGMILGLALYVNLLPPGQSDTLVIALVHVPLLLWCVFGLSYISFNFRDTRKRTAFIRYTGELLTMTGLLLITGGMLTGITIGLFSAIGTNIEDWYLQNVVIPGAAMAPVLAAYLVTLYPDITRRIVPVIARVFTPLVLVTLAIFLVSLAFSGTRILEDRDLLALFNVMLLAVTAIIIFSVTELNKSRRRNIHVMILLILALVTLLINVVALTAIFTRLTYGLTPNRLVVSVTNVLVFVNLVLIAKDLFLSWSDAAKLDSLERTVARYLVVYFLWTVVAVFVLPWVMG